MRTKIAKRIGPVPIALVAVLALAAFISAGLLLAPNANTPTVSAVSGVKTATDYVAGANECALAHNTCTSAGPATIILTGKVTPDKTTYHVYTDGAISGGTPVPLYFFGTSNDEIVVDGGDNVFPLDTPNPSPLSYMKVEIPAGDYREAPKVEITVSPSRKQQTTLVAYQNSNPPGRVGSESADVDIEFSYLLADPGVDANPIVVDAPMGNEEMLITFTPGLGAPNADASIVDVYVGSIVTEVNNIDTDGEVDNVKVDFKDAVSVTYSGYAMTTNAAEPGQVEVMNLSPIVIGFREGQTVGEDAEITITQGEDSAKSMVSAVVFGTTDGTRHLATVTIDPAFTQDQMDAFETEAESGPATITLNYERSLEGDVVISVGGGSDVMLESGFVQAKTFTITAKQARALTALQVVGLPETGNVRVPVTAEFTSSGGATLTKTGHVVRSDMVPDSITATTYSCKQDNVGPEKMPDPGSTTDVPLPDIANPSKICAVEMLSTTNVSKLAETVAFAPGSMFVIVANVADSAGTAIPMDMTVTGRQTSPSGTAAITVANGMTRGNMGEARLVATVKGKDDAALGDYTIEVAQGRALLDVMVSVTGPTTLVMITGDDTIPTATGLGRYTIKATDTNGNVPTDLYSDHDDDDETAMVLSKKVLVAVRVDGARVLGVNQETGEVTLDKNGEATFTVQMPQDAVAGTTVSITVYIIGTDITDTVIAMYGEMNGEPPTMMETDGFTADYTVTVTSDEGSGMVDVSWTRSEELSLSLVSLIQGGEVVDFTITLGTSAQFSEVDPSEYDVSVFSFRNNADGKDGAIAFGTVTVE